MMKNENHFWAFMREREAIRLRRAAGLPREQWTNDPIMREWSFTNVKREHDRTTIAFAQIYKEHRPTEHPSKVALLNATIYRYHGTVLAADVAGWHDEWSRDHARALAKKMQFQKDLGKKIFTGAYIIPMMGLTGDKTKVVANIVTDIYDNADLALATDSWQRACEALKRINGVGSFMAKEVLLDYIIATGWEPCDWNDWTPVGPGARRGAAVVLTGDVRGVKENIALGVCQSLFKRRHDNLPSDFVELSLTDIQFQLCELAKYWKAKMGQNPKRRFKPRTTT